MGNLIYNIWFLGCIFICIVYKETIPKNITISLAAIGIPSGFYLFLLFARKIKNKRRKRRILLSRVKKGILAVRGITIYVITSIVVIPLAVAFIISGGKIGGNVQKTSSHMEQYTMANYIDDIKKIQNEEWEQLSLEERLEVCQTIANIEANYLGLPSELEVVASPLESNIQGEYLEVKRLIKLDREYLLLLSAGETVEAVTHEVRHAYQYRLLDVYYEMDEDARNLRVFQDVPEFEYEFQNYISSEEDFEGYYSQLCEQDAREYSEVATLRYYQYLDKHLTKEE